MMLLKISIIVLIYISLVLTTMGIAYMKNKKTSFGIKLIMPFTFAGPPTLIGWIVLALILIYS